MNRIAECTRVRPFDKLGAGCTEVQYLPAGRQGIDKAGNKKYLSQLK